MGRCLQLDYEIQSILRDYYKQLYANKMDNLGSRHKPVARVSPHHKRPEAEARPRSSETANLTDGASDPCGPDSKVQATSVKVAVTGHQPGGTVEKVTDFS